MNLFQRANRLLSTKMYGKVSGDLLEMPHNLNVPTEEQYVLRMLVKSPETDGFMIPEELGWLESLIKRLDDVQNDIFRIQPYVYVTVRNGLVQSVTDDEWHVDGFSMRVNHCPEQNYIWSDCYPTEYLDQKFVIPEDFNPFRHNIQHFFHDNADKDCIRTMKPKHLAIIDPYVVHRRPVVPEGTERCFVRISFVPIEIEDDTCSHNPLLPKKTYGRDDIRKALIRYGN